MSRGISYTRDVADRKGKHKQYICKYAYGWDYYDNSHQYSKGKIHCSCPCCTAKTNTSKYKSRGMVDPNKRHSMKITGTSHKNWKHSDAVKNDSMEYQELNYMR